MSLEKIGRVIEDYFEDGWDSTPKTFQNAGTVDGATWIRVSVLFGDPVKRIGCKRNIGRLIINIFTEVGASAQPARIIADNLESLAANQVISGEDISIHMGTPSYSDQGESGGRYQSNLQIPFFCDIPRT